MAQEATTKVVVFDGTEYTIAEHPLADLDALEALEDSRYASLAKAILGAKQYAAFRKEHKTSEQLFELVSALLDMGETSEEE